LLTFLLAPGSIGRKNSIVSSVEFSHINPLLPDSPREEKRSPSHVAEEHKIPKTKEPVEVKPSPSTEELEKAQATIEKLIVRVSELEKEVR
jgi:hypothetical protein